MIEGAIREDDYEKNALLETLGCAPPQNPPSAINRPLRHFLDVQRGGQGLHVGPFEAISATDWGLGAQGRGAGPADNQFSILDARNYQLRSLTDATRESRERHTALLFRSLGQVIHTLQDMAQPQHTRNDPHTGCVEALAGERSWYEDYLERRALGQRFRRRADQPFPLVLAGYPPPRFAAYRDFFTQSSGAGLADFSSRNFFSAGTNLSLLEICGGLPEPPCQRDTYTQRETPFAFTAVDGTPVAGLVTLFLHTIQDPVTGDALPDLAVSSRSLWDQHLERRGFFPRFTLNSLNYDSISDVLIPRAVGYSVGLLDYFFRGRLDVELAPDAVDPTLVRIEGTNASAEALDGRLELYGDDGLTGLRQQLPSPEGEPRITVPAGGRVRSPAFRLPPENERIVAVYQGALGNEAPITGAPGAIIAKSLGGLRVEQVFFDFDAGLWKLRTPKGVFVLKRVGSDAPLTLVEFMELRWGDGDRLVAISAIGPGKPNQVIAYTVRRDEASPVGLVTEPSPQGTVVRLVEHARASIPVGLSLGTSVSLANTIHYRQRMVTVESITTLVYEPEAVRYEVAGQMRRSEVTTIAADSMSFTANFPLVLDPSHFLGATPAPLDQPSYAWFLQEATVDEAGHLLALVGAFVVTPRDNRVERIFFDLEGPGAGTLRPTPIQVGQKFPLSGDLLAWALVDLTAGQVLGSTAGPSISITSTSFVETPQWVPVASGARPKVYHHQITQFIGGPQDGQDFDHTDAVPMTRPPLDTTGRQYALEETLTLELGGSAAISGRLRGDLQAPLAGLERVSDSVQTFTDAWESGTLVRVQAVATMPTTLRFDPRMTAARWVRDGQGRLALIATGQLGGQSTDAVVAWDPRRSQAQVPLRLASQTEDGGTELNVTAAAGSVALVEAFGHGGAYLVSLDGSFAPRFFADPGLLSGFTLLGSGLLYDTTTQRFFRSQPPLQSTPLPARLAPFSGNAVGDHHAIRLP